MKAAPRPYYCVRDVTRNYLKKGLAMQPVKRETEQVMSEENVAAFKRGLDAYNRRDLDALFAELEPDVEFPPALAVLLGGEKTVFRGHQGMRESIQEEDEALADFQVKISEIRDLGHRVLAIGHARIRGKESGVRIESPFCVLTESKGTKGTATRAALIRT